jgi:Apea-like HEPN
MGADRYGRAETYKRIEIGNQAESVTIGYKFRNRIKVRDTGRRLGIDVWEWVLLDDHPKRVTLSTDSEAESIANADSLILNGAEYSNFESALIAGRRWRQILSVYFARVGFSVDLGDDREELCTPHELNRLDSTKQPGLTDESVIYQDRIGLYIIPSEPSAMFFFGWAYGENQISVGRAGQLMRAIAIRNQDPWGDELKLAYKLFHASLADPNPETRYILAVTAIEALIPHRERIPEVVSVLDRLRAYVNEQADEIGRELAGVVKQLLHSDKYESVRSFGLRLADRLTGNYDGISPREYFDHIYGIRSELAHGALRDIGRLDTDALNQQMSELRRFVLDILAAWTTEYSNSPTNPS